MLPPPVSRVAIIGAGASGMAALHALTAPGSGKRFHVTIFDKQETLGGMATSIPIDETKFGADFVNDGVQGCSPAFANTLRLFTKELGFGFGEVDMQISFGKGPDDFWTNVFKSPLTSRSDIQADIRKFGRVLKLIHKMEPIFVFIPVHRLLSLFRFSKDFGEKLIYPLVALFFGTGNQTPFISSVILERVFEDPKMRLFEFDKDQLLGSVPKMIGFPKLEDVYGKWAESIKSHASDQVVFRLGHEVLNILDRKKNHVVVQYKANGEGAPTHDFFDELIFACDADAALKILGKQASWRERWVLGSVKYLYDVTITHNDKEYMKKHYEVESRDEIRAEDPESGLPFCPLYLTKQYEEDKKKIEMSFDLSIYQPQFRKGKDRQKNVTGPVTTEEQQDHQRSDAEQDSQDHDHVYQTIFLDRDGSQQLWTWDEIKEDKRIKEKWWKQQSHRWQHYVKVVPWMMALNGKNHTQFAGAWTILNMHEIALTSGFAAAYRLGAPFPFKREDDEPGEKYSTGECLSLFRLYLALSHGMRLRKEDRNGFFS